jgi:tetratricopeptide (TPR) repeat protein
VSVTVTPPDHFNTACRSCHTAPHQECTLTVAERIKQADNCFKCHMPVSETLDIPHVTVHDHRIQIPVSKEKQNAIIKFVGLECMTSKNPSDLLMAQGYLQTYEAYSQQPFLLDSAAKFLNRISKTADSEVMKARIRLFFLQKDYSHVTGLASNISTINDDWTLYRIGESYFQSSDFINAEQYFSKAVSLDSSNLEFLNKKGSAAMALNNLDLAKQCFQKCVDENPKFAPAINNLGYVSFAKGDLSYANTLFDKALALDPDYEQALMNKAALLFSQNQNAEAKKFIQRVLTINPQNIKAKSVLQHFPGNDHQ